MTEVNNITYEVSDADSTALTLKFNDSDGEGYIDTSSFTTYTSGGTLTEVDNSFSGLSHLEGETVTLLLDGTQSTTDTVSSGAITTTEWHNSVSVGLYSTREIQLLPYEGPKTLGRTKHVVGQLMAVFRTLGGRYGPMSSDGVIDPARIRNIDWSSVSDPWSWDVDEFTGVKHITDSWGVAERHTMVIQQTEPLPMTLLMVEPDVEVS